MPQLCFEVANAKNNPFIALTFSESPEFADRLGDATTEKFERDLPLYFTLTKSTNCVGPDYIRGGFKYLTVFMPIDGSPRDGFDGFWHRGMSPPLTEQNSWLEQLWFKTQKYLGLGSADDNRGNIVNNGDHGNHRQHGKHRKRRASITKIWVNFIAFPSNPIQ